jgi:hypothetical protein
MTMYDSRSRARPPCPRYAQSPQREPIVTGVRRAEGFRLWLHGVDRCGQHIHHSSEEDSQVVNLHAGQRHRWYGRPQTPRLGVPLQLCEPRIYVEIGEPPAKEIHGRGVAILLCNLLLRRSNLLPGLRTLLGWVVLR